MELCFIKRWWLSGWNEVWMNICWSSSLINKNITAKQNYGLKTNFSISDSFCSYQTEIFVWNHVSLILLLRFRHLAAILFLHASKDRGCCWTENTLKTNFSICKYLCGCFRQAAAYLVYSASKDKSVTLNRISLFVSLSLGVFDIQPQSWFTMLRKTRALLLKRNVLWKQISLSLWVFSTSSLKRGSVRL